MKAKQKGFVNFSESFFRALFVLAILGLIAVFLSAGWVIVWLFQHMRFV